MRLRKSNRRGRASAGERLASIVSPAPPTRAQALARMERIAAVTHLVSSLGYLARPRDRRRGGLNNWEISGRSFHARSESLGRVLDVMADRRVTSALHGVRISTVLALLLAPLSRRGRLAADATLSATSVALYPRHHYGTDGSDQVSFLVQSISPASPSDDRRSSTRASGMWRCSPCSPTPSRAGRSSPGRRGAAAKR